MAGFMAAAILLLSTPFRELNRSPDVDDGLLGHGAPDVVGRDEVHATAVGQAADAVDARDHRQRPATAVMPTRRARTNPGMQADGEDVHQRLVGPGGLGGVKRLIARWAGRTIERRRRACACWLFLSRSRAR